jgi:uncharacterized YccA/Bax inhibitor family protein
MTREGAMNKSILLVGIMLLTGLYSFGSPSTILMWGGAIGGLVLFFVTMFKPSIANITAPIYAAFEGLFVGAISAVYAAMYSGIILQAVSVTICILLMMLMIYRSNIIPVTNKLRTGIIAATGAVFLLYMLSIGLGFFGINIPFLHSGGTMGIVISLVIIGIASMNLLLDFDSIDKGDQMGLPKYMEWYFGMSLLATLVWIYVEVLRLIAVLNRD